jgi:ATP-binding protein involved in chromosome partitioning
MAQKTGMRVIGAVENMSYLSGTGQELFGSGGGQALADEVGVPLLARIPFDPVMREAADDGAPVAEVAPDSESAAAIAALAESVAATRAGVIRKPLTLLS